MEMCALIRMVVEEKWRAIKVAYKARWGQGEMILANSGFQFFHVSCERWFPEISFCLVSRFVRRQNEEKNGPFGDEHVVRRLDFCLGGGASDSRLCGQT